MSNFKKLSLLNGGGGLYIWVYFTGSSMLARNICVELIFLLIGMNFYNYIKMKEKSEIKLVFLIAFINSFAVLFINGLHFEYLKDIFFVIYVLIAICLWFPKKLDNIITKFK